jgi:hypothetical protein
MTTGTRWHAIRRIVPHSIIARVQMIQNLQRKGMDRVPVRAALPGAVPSTTIPSDRSRLEVRMMCPKCGETRLIERVDGHRWFCAVCAHSWTASASGASHEP